MHTVKWLNIWSIDETLIVITTPGRSGPGSNDNEEEYFILQSSRTWALPSDAVSYHIHDIFGVGKSLTPVGVFYNPSRLGFYTLSCLRELVFRKGASARLVGLIVCDSLSIL